MIFLFESIAPEFLEKFTENRRPRKHFSLLKIDILCKLPPIFLLLAFQRVSA